MLDDVERQGNTIYIRDPLTHESTIALQREIKNTILKDKFQTITIWNNQMFLTYISDKGPWCDERGPKCDTIFYYSSLNEKTIHLMNLPWLRKHDTRLVQSLLF